MWWEVVDLLNLAKDRNKLWDGVNTAQKLRVLYKTENLCTGYELLAFQNDPA